MGSRCFLTPTTAGGAKRQGLVEDFFAFEPPVCPGAVVVPPVWPLELPDPDPE
jgi:hypothetical protein